MSAAENSGSISRRELSRRFGLAAIGGLASSVPSFACSPAIRVPGPEVVDGVASGDVSGNSAVVWSRADRASRMVVEYATTDRFQDAKEVVGPVVDATTDFAAKTVLTELPPGQTIFYRVSFRDTDNPTVSGVPVIGQFRTPPRDRRDIRFVWGGDVAGQGFGIDKSRGGMASFESMNKESPDFFLHSGDHIYADVPIPAEVKLEDGALWKNIVTPETSKVAEKLDEFRGRYRYNFLDDHFRKFAADVPVLAQWDDHEVLNNWYPSEILKDDARYTEKSVDVLASRARQAFFERLPVLTAPQGEAKVYRKISYGPLLDVFLLDERTYRGPNNPNTQTEISASTAFLGTAQLAWLKSALQASKATWKVIASDMPLGLIVRDGPGQLEAVANGNGPALGRELEIAHLLYFLKKESVVNTVWFTADVHYAAAHHYDPSRARFTEFNPFWEFVAGPLHAGTFGPGQLDDTFGPEVKFSSKAPGSPSNLPPSDGQQFFGQVRIDGKTQVMTVSLHNRYGKSLDTRDLAPA